MSQRLELQQQLPLATFSLIEVPDSALEDMLEDLLLDVKLHKVTKPKGNGRNLFNTEAFINKCKEYRAKTNLTPAYRINFNSEGLQLDSLRNFDGVHHVLREYLVPKEEKRSSEQNFSRKFLDSLNWKVKKQEEIVRYVLETQREAIESGDVYKLKPLTMASIAEIVKVHETTVSRLVKDLIISLHSAELPISDFIINENSGLTRIRLASYILNLSREYNVQSLSTLSISDEEIARKYSGEHQISVSRRLVTKVRNDFEKNRSVRIGRPIEISDTIEHWLYERPITEEDISRLAVHNLDESDTTVLSQGITKTETGGYIALPLKEMPSTSLWYHFLHSSLSETEKTNIQQEIDFRAKNSERYNSEMLASLRDYQKFYPA